MAGNKKRSLFPGFVRIKVRGKQLERFLNLCDRQGIIFSSISFPQPEVLTAVLSADDFFRLQQARRKTHVQIRISQKTGLSFFLLKSRRRKAFILGLFFALLILFFFHSRIWQIHIEGNRMYATTELLEFLEDQGIRPGIVSGAVNCSKITESLRKQFSNITWVSAQKRGTELSLTIREGIPEEKTQEAAGACDLEAEEAGTIVKMVTRSGYPKAVPGDTCEKGDILVLGTFPILNDDQDVVRYESVHADADVFIERKLSYYREYPLTQKRAVPVGDKKDGFFLHIRDFYFYPGGSGGKKEEKGNNFRVTCQWETPVKILENLSIPVIFGKEIAYAYKNEVITYTKKEMEMLLWQELQDYEQNLLEKGLQISANDVTIRVDSYSGVSSGTLTVIQKIGKEVPITRREELAEAERNPTESE